MAERMMTMSKMIYIEYSGYQFLVIKLFIYIITQASIVELSKRENDPSSWCSSQSFQKESEQKGLTITTISVVNDEDEKWIYQRGSVCDKSFRSRLRRSGGEKGRNSSAICFQRLDVSQTGDQDRMYHLRASLTSITVLQLCSYFV